MMCSTTQRFLIPDDFFVAPHDQASDTEALRRLLPRLYITFGHVEGVTVLILAPSVVPPSRPEHRASHILFHAHRQPNMLVQT